MAAPKRPVSPGLLSALQWVGVSSSNVEALAWTSGWDGKGVLWVAYRAKGGSPRSVYTYTHRSPGGTPESVYEAMLGAGSVGQFRHQHLTPQAGYDVVRVQ
jgi:hypothetical protein